MSELVANLEKLRKQKKVNLARSAYEQIKEAIVYAKFKPGECLSENMLAEVLEMSRTPVREALKELTNEDLVEIVPGRGVIVKDISRKNLKEIFELRKVLECLAAETAIANLTEAEILNLENDWLTIMTKINQGEKVAWEHVSRCDNKLHSTIINNCDNSYLKDFMKVLNQQILRYQLLTAQALDDVKDTVRQHLEIIKLLKERDPGALIPVLRKHIELAERIILKGRF